MNHTRWAKRTVLSDEQRHERNQMCIDIVLASRLTGKPAAVIAQAVFDSLPSDHWLLQTKAARDSFNLQLAHAITLAKAENKIYKQAHS
jgi:hypothetical protein